MREIEVKIRIENADEARRELGKAGAVAMTPRYFEDNRVYDDVSESLKSRERLLRLRTVGEHHVLTFKTPPVEEGEPARYKVRLEHETRIGDPAVIDSILTALGYRTTYRYQKFRQRYRMDDVIVELDETPIGVFIELEGPPAAIDAAASRLGFGSADYITKTYRTLHVETAGSDPPGDMVFSPEPES
ncbi:MAG: class IV adenylate cyclase [Acidobacteriota bacterium]|nr:MAG: class IV adenylate cyclase [Acidobacteriota bacterium]